LTVQAKGFKDALGLASGLGLLDEATQLLVPGRYFDWRDVLFNGGAPLGAITASWSMDWIRRRSAK
jgi:VanZ family protein